MTAEPATTSEACCAIAETLPAGDHLDHAARVFKALSDPTRLRILRTIARMDELCECNIVPAFELSQPTISYHLKILREAGLLRSERRGQWVYHRVNQRALLGSVRDLTGIIS
jgi:ArsR family transcriptional regulator